MNYNDIKDQLKQEFFGIDEQIDKVVDVLEAHLSVSQYQLRPNIVCLWGMTGTGKTELINRAIKLLKKEDQYLYVKFSNGNSDASHLFKFNNSLKNPIILLDEFQYLRTKNEFGNEREESQDNSVSQIWDLLGDGKILFNNEDLYWAKYTIQLDIIKLKKLYDMDVKIKNGCLYHDSMDIEKIINEVFDRTNSRGEAYRHEPPKNIEHDPSLDEPTIDDALKYKLVNEIGTSSYDIATFINKRRSDELYEIRDIRLMFDSFNDLNEAINFLNNEIEKKVVPAVADYSKSLIFVIGNLDECYSVANDINNDMDADLVHKKTSRVNILDIRKALLARFRAEQVARLGSNHIIYATLPKSAFNSIINRELNHIEKSLIDISNSDNDLCDINSVTFTDNIRKLLYNEGVMPIVGARSIISYLSSVITSKIPSIITKLKQLSEPSDIIFDYNLRSKQILININGSDDVLSFDYVSVLNKLRDKSNKDIQTCTAVHEAGHVVASIVLCGVIPRMVYSKIINEIGSGVTLFDDEYDKFIVNKNTFGNIVSMQLAGMAAESYVFGDELVTNGSQHDIREATKFVHDMMTKCGFTDSIASRTHILFPHNEGLLPDDENKIAKNIDIFVKKCYNDVLDILKSERLFLTKLSEYLSKHSKMSNKMIIKYAKMYMNHSYENCITDKTQYINNFKSFLEQTINENQSD